MRQFNLRLSQAARLFPGHKPAPSTMNRYCAKGVLSPNGARVRLESIRIGRYRYTNRTAVRAFIEALNPPEHDRAEAELISDGC